MLFTISRRTTTLDRLVSSEQVAIAVYGITHGFFTGLSETNVDLDNCQNAKGFDYSTKDGKFLI